MNNKLITIILLLIIQKSLIAQYKIDFGIETGANFNSTVGDYAIANKYLRDNFLIKEVASDSEGKGVNIGVNATIHYKQLFFTIGAGISYLSHKRNYSLQMSRDTLLNYTTDNNTFYWQYRFSANYEFDLKNNNSISLGLGVSANDYIEGQWLVGAGGIKNSIYASDFNYEYLYNTSEHRSGKTKWNPFFVTSYKIPYEKFDIRFQYRLTLGWFSEYYSTLFVYNESGYEKTLIFKYIGGYNHNFSLIFNFNLFDDGLEEKRQEMKRKKKALK